MNIRRRWLRNALAVIRWSRILAYIGLAVSGAASLAHPPASVQASAGFQVTIYVWASVLCLSSIICMIGAITDRWVGEYMGLVPLGLSALVFAVSAMSRGVSGVAGGAFLFGFFWFLASRWQEVALLRVESVRRAERDAGDDQ